MRHVPPGDARPGTRRASGLSVVLAWLCVGCGAHHTETTLPPTAAPLPGHRLVWHDEFDGAALDTTRWTVHAGPRRDATNTPDAIAVADGVLTIATFHV